MTNKAIPLTYDAPEAIFKRLQAFYVRTGSPCFHLVHVPHHGSKGNFQNEFWNKLQRINNCPAVFSVGDEPRDKLPNVEVAQSISSMGFDVHSTNAVYRIGDFFNKPTPKKLPSIFSMVPSAGSSSSVTSNKFSGHQSFDL